MIRIEVEHQIGSEPPLLLYRRRIRFLVVCTRIVHVCRDPAREERLELLPSREAKMPLDDPRGPEHETELAPSETVWKRRLESIIVAVELRLQELRGRLLRAIRDRHRLLPSGSRP